MDLGYTADRTYTVVFGLGSEQAQALISEGQSETPPVTFGGLRPDTRYTVDAVIRYGGTVIDTISRRIRTDAGGGGEEYHYACYDVTHEEYIDGYTNYDDRTTDDDTITEPSPSGYTYEGYIYYDNFAQCINQYFDTGRYDSEDESDRTVSLGAYSHVVFFYRNTGGGGDDSASVSLSIGAGEIVPVTVYFPYAGTYTFETEGDLDTYGYLSYASVSDVVTNSSGKKEPSSYLAYNDDVPGTTNFRIDFSVSGGTAYKIWVRFYSVSTSGTVTLKITPAVGTFYGKMTTNGKTAANINALFENGDAVYSNYRYIRLKLNGSWTTINGSTYASSTSAGGASSTFSVTKTGLTAGTMYTYEVHLYYRSGSSYIDTGLYISGSFTTDQDASAIMIYHNGWKNAVPYIYTGGAWHKCSSRLYRNGWKS